MTSARISRRLWALAVLAVALAACSNGGAKQSATYGSPGATASGKPTAASSGAKQGEGSARPLPGSTNTGTTQTNKTTTATKAAANVPPAPGNYTYAQSGSTKAGPYELSVDPTGTLKVDPATSASGGKRQHDKRVYSSNWSQERRFLFTPAGVYLERTVVSLYGQTQTCETQDPLLAVPLPLKVGATWKDAGDCSGIHIAISGTILRSETRTVGGRSVPTYVLKVVAKASGEDTTQTTTDTTWLSPDYRMIVRNVSDSSGTSRGVDFTQHLVEDLKSLSPA